MSKSEIEEALKNKGDFVQINELTSLSKKEMPIDVKKFVYLKIAGIYEKKGMFNEVAKMFNNLGILAIAYSEKIKNYVKSAEYYIKAGYFESADESMKKAMSQANDFQKQDIWFAIKNFYKTQAETYEKELRRNSASKIYEKLLEMNLTSVERDQIKERLFILYEKLGKFKEAQRLKILK